MLSCVHMESNAGSGQSPAEQADAIARREMSGAGNLRIARPEEMERSFLVHLPFWH
jgi:hypothetical protein